MLRLSLRVRLRLKAEAKAKSCPNPRCLLDWALPGILGSKNQFQELYGVVIRKAQALLIAYTLVIAYT